jgi:hypothetical protein
MVGRNVQTLSLPDLVLHAGQAGQLAIHDVMTKLPQIEAVDLAFSYTGAWGDIVAGTGSLDAAGNYVFPVPAQPASQAGSLSSIYWLVSGGFDTMYTVWNPLATTQELLLTLNYGTAGETWRMPLELEPYASAMIDIGELVRTQQSDQDGNALPPDVQQGSLLLTGAANATDQPITAVLSGAIYNPQKATCGMTCETCNGLTNVGLSPGSTIVAVGGESQATFSYTWYTGAQYNITSSSNWSSGTPQVATVQGGLSKGVSVGTAEIEALDPNAVPINPGQICSGGGTLPTCPSTYPQATQAATVFQLTCSPTSVVRGGSTTCTAAGVSASQITGWSFSGGGQDVTGPAGTLSWSGTMAVGGTVTASTAGGTASQQVTVSPRSSGFIVVLARPTIPPASV